jgi:hypothetical protein
MAWRFPFVLSPFRAAEYAAMERRFERDHIDRALAAAGDDAALRHRLTLAAVGDIADGRFRYGRRRFDSCTMAASAAPMLLQLSLRVKNPAITEAMAGEILARAADGGARILTALWEMLGHFDEGPPAHRTAESPGTRQREGDVPDFGLMRRTGAAARRQPSGQGSARSVGTTARARSLEEASYRAMLRRQEIFDRIRAERRWTPDQLARQPAETLAGLIRQCQGGAVDVNRLADWTGEYARRKAEHDAREKPLAQTSEGGPTP